ncbi:MAG: phage portal protein [Bacillus sp. (in: Bacteria)]|nr:phage portal protein [Bacillus sp. (in: firmicutes)]
MGNHKILNKSIEYWGGREFRPTTIVLQYAKTILAFEVAYLLKNKVTLAGDEKLVEEFKRVYKKAKIHRKDMDILDKMCKYGQVFEYIYLDDKNEIASKIIDVDCSYPIYNYKNELIGFIEYWTTDQGISYYYIYYPEYVEEWTNEGGKLRLVNTYENISGLPVCYQNLNEEDSTQGYSDLEDWVNIIDQMEELISKYHDAVFKFLAPIGVISGMKLAIGKNGEGAISPNIIGPVLQLDNDSTFNYAKLELSDESFKILFNTLKQCLLDISMTPAVSLNSQEISNLSEVSIKLLFSLADIKAGINERYVREGFEQRFERISKLLSLKGIKIDPDAEIDVVFQYARPQNDKDIIDMLKVLNDMGAISLQTLLENSPLIYDVVQEMERIGNDKAKRDITDKVKVSENDSQYNNENDSQNVD